MAQINSKLTPSGSVTLPASGSVALFSELSDDGRLYLKDSDGNVYPAVDASGSSGITNIPVSQSNSGVGSATAFNFSGSSVDNVTISGGVATIALIW